MKKKKVPRHNKYQSLVKFYEQGDDIASWLRNLESVLRGEEILDEDWAFNLWKSLSSEWLKIIESVPDELLNDYEYLKERVGQHFSLTE